MKKTAIIYNRFLNSKSYSDNLNIYKEGISSCGIEVLLVPSDSLLSPDFKLEFDCCIFLDKDVIAAKLLESLGICVLNGSENISICDDKALTYATLYNKGINMPKTYVSAFKFKEDYPYFSQIPPFPFILKEAKGSWGEQVYLIYNKEEFDEKLKDCFGKRCIIQEYLKEGNSDIRVITVDKKAILAMKRTNANDFRSNAEQGGKCESFQLTDEVKALAEKVSLTLGIDFAGIDIVVENGVPYLIEVNSNPFINKITEVTKINPAKKIGELIKAL